MKKLKFTTLAAAALFAGITLVSCKDKSTETEGGDTMGTETGAGYDETQAPTGEPGNADMNPGADGQTGTVNDSTTTNGNNAGSGANGSGNNTGSGNTTGSGSTGNPNTTNRP